MACPLAKPSEAAGARLPRKFYERSTLKVAPEVLGHLLIRKAKGKRQKIISVITEVEAYVGEGDPACHAARGRTERNKVMYGEAGHAYVYFIYGMYYCFNIVTEGIGFPAAVLVRGVAPIKAKGKRQKSSSHSESRVGEGRRIPWITGAGNRRELLFAADRKLNGPGKLCRELGIDKRLNGADLARGRELWIEKNPRRREFLKQYHIKKAPRVGIKKGRDKLWRWILV